MPSPTYRLPSDYVSCCFQNPFREVGTFEFMSGGLSKSDSLRYIFCFPTFRRKVLDFERLRCWWADRKGGA